MLSDLSGRTDRTTRRTFLVSTGAIGVSGLAGCAGGSGRDGSSDGGDGDSTNTEAASDGGEQGATTGNGPERDVTLQFWHPFGGGLGETTDSIVTQFEEESDRITIETTSNQGYDNNLSATFSAINAGNAPHVSLLGGNAMQTPIDSGKFVPTEDLLEGHFDYENVFDALRESFTVDGTVWTHPWNTSLAILYLNVDMFESAGLDPQDPPISYGEVRTACETLVAETDVDQGITWPTTMWHSQHWLTWADQFMINKENGRTGTPTELYFDTDVVTELYEWWNGLYEDDLFFNAGVYKQDAATQAFVTGKVAMNIQSTAGVASMEAGAKENGFEIRTAPFPATDGRPGGTLLTGGTLWVPKQSVEDSAVREATAEFLTWLAKPEQQNRWHKQTGYIPGHKESVPLLEEEGWFEKNPNFRTAIEEVQASTPTPATKFPLIGPINEMRTVVTDGFVKMTQGTPVSDTLASTKQEGDDLLQEYKQQQG